MNVRLNNILRTKEWLIIAAGLLAAGAIYALMIHPSIQSLAALDQARSEKNQAEKKLAQAREKLQELQRQITEGKKQLTAIGGSPPPASEKDLQIARLTTLAGECNITIDRYLPIGTVEYESHQSTYFQFSGQGNYVSIQRFFKRIESELDFVDITHFRITSINQDASGSKDRNTGANCLISWSCRINGMTLNTTDRQQSVQSRADRSASMEVVLHEP